MPQDARNGKILNMSRARNFAVLGTLALAAIGLAQVPQLDRYAVVDLGAPNGSLGSKPNRINSVGHTIGGSFPGAGRTSAWINFNNVTGDMGVLRDTHTNAYTRGISPNNTVLGASGTGLSVGPDTEGFIWTPTTGMSPITYTLPDPIPVQGVIPPDKHPGSMNVFEGVDMNQLGQFIYNGEAFPQEPSTGVEITGLIAMFDNPLDNPNALPYNPLYIKPLGTGDSLFARKINNLGTVVGMNIAVNGDYKVFQWKPPAAGTEEGQTQELQVLISGDTFVDARDVNDLNMAIGNSVGVYTPPMGFGNYFLPTGWVVDIDNAFFCERRYYLRPAIGDTLTDPFGINNNGLIVGRTGSFVGSDTDGQFSWRGALWYPVICDPEAFPPPVGYTQAPILLDSLVPPGSGWKVLNATSINDAGQITAVAVRNNEVRSIRLDPVRYPIDLTFNPNPVGGGTTVQGTITLDKPALPGGTVITLSSARSEAQPPATVTVPAGDDEVTFDIPTSMVTQNVSVAITASNQGQGKTSQLNILPIQLKGIDVPLYIEGGVNTPCNIQLTGTAPTNLNVTFTSSNTTILPVPNPVTIAQGTMQTTVTLAPPVVTQDYLVNLRATLNGITKTKNVVVVPVVGDYFPIAIAFDPNQFAGQGTIQGSILLNEPVDPNDPPARVHLKSTNPAVTVPTIITVDPGSDTQVFTMTITPVAARTAVLIDASVSGKHARKQITLNALAVNQVVINNPVTGGTTGTARVVLNGTAITNFRVDMTSSNPSVATVPAFLFVLAGQTQRTFNIPTQRVLSNTNVTITARSGAITRTAVLQVVVPFLADLTLASNTVVGGNNVVGTVRMSGLVNAPGATVNLRTTSTSVAQVPATLSIPANTSTRNFNITTSVVAFPVNVTIIATHGTVTRTKVLTVNP